MTGDSLAWFLAAAFVAEIAGTMAGFGAATILTPIAVLFMDIKTAVAIVACFHLFGNVSRLRFFGRDIHWRTFWLFGAAGVMMSLIGAQVASAWPAPAIKACLGGFLLLFVASSLVQSDRVRLPRAPATLVGGGLLSGFIAGVIGTGGAVRSACLLAFHLPREAYLGTSAALALSVDGVRVPVYLREGFIPSTMLPVLACLVPVAFAGAWVGQRLVRRLSPRMFQVLVSTLLAVMGAKLVWDGAHGR